MEIRCILARGTASGEFPDENDSKLRSGYLWFFPHWPSVSRVWLRRRPAKVAPFSGEMGPRGVNPDTHLVLTFFSAPTLGKSGLIRIYDAADHSLVDTLDLSIPAGPDPTHRFGSPPAAAIDPNPPRRPQPQLPL